MVFSIFGFCWVGMDWSGADPSSYIVEEEQGMGEEKKTWIGHAYKSVTCSSSSRYPRSHPIANRELRCIAGQGMPVLTKLMRLLVCPGPQHQHHLFVIYIIHRVELKAV